MSTMNLSRQLCALMTCALTWGAITGVLAPSTTPEASAEAPVARKQQADTTRRYALLVGANDGGTERVKLRYAGSDARAVGKVLAQLGGVQRADQMIVLDPSPRAFEAAVRKLSARIRRDAPGRSEVILYYSGHSDERGLLLRGSRVGYDQLRKHLKTIPADVRVLILDSCSSGMMTRTKGGRRTPAFLRDRAVQVRGQAILTSSSATEAAQESDQLGSSFFTHAFISGLRGAADASGDRRVTLNEAYQFAFRETLRRTQKTRAGAQHPGYDLQLTGHGDLVLTDLAQTNAALQLAPDVGGRLFIRDSKGQLVAELFKAPGRALELGLPADKYRVGLASKGGKKEARISVRSGGRTRLTLAQFRSVTQEKTRLRGGAPLTGPNLTAQAHEPASDRQAPAPFGMDLVPFVGSSSYAPLQPRRYSLNLIAGLDGGVEGFELGGAVNINAGDVRGGQISGAANIVSGGLYGAQLGGAANIIVEDVRGLQIAGGANIVAGSLRGVQLSGGANIVADAATGVQISATNIVSGGLYGAQIGALNFSASTRGFQLGAVNVSGDTRGAQIGAVNVGGDVTGFQLGAINVARRSSYSLGVINIFRDGDTSATAWVNETEFLSAGVKHGGDHFYNIYSVGVFLADNSLTAGLGLGWRGPISDHLTLEGDLMVQQMFTSCCASNMNLFNKARVMVRWEIFDGFAVYGGPTLTVLVSNHMQEQLVPIEWRLSAEDDPTRVSMWPGFAIGVDVL